jgi:hypothetical protein
MLGLTEKMTTMIEGPRFDELEISKKFRRIQTLKFYLGESGYTGSGDDGLTAEKQICLLLLVSLLHSLRMQSLLKFLDLARCQSHRYSRYLLL